MQNHAQEQVVPLSADRPLWEQVFTVAPLVVVGTLEENGRFDFAPKHMAMPIGWGNYFGFVCTPRHGTYQNLKRTGEFTVSYPRPNQVVMTTLTAASRSPDGAKHVLNSLPTFPAKKIKGVFLQDAYLFLECKLMKIEDGFDDYSLIIGSVAAAYAASDSLRVSENNDDQLLQTSPLLAYLNWGRYAPISGGYSFPFLKDFKR